MAEFDRDNPGEGIGWLTRWRDFVDAGLHVASATDAPWTFPDFELTDDIGRPVDQIAAGIDGRARASPETPPWLLDQLLTAEQGLRAVTLDAAYALGDEASRGHLAPGTLGDVTILSGDVLDATPDEIRAMTVIATIVGRHRRLLRRCRGLHASRGLSAETPTSAPRGRPPRASRGRRHGSVRRASPDRPDSRTRGGSRSGDRRGGRAGARRGRDRRPWPARCRPELPRGENHVLRRASGIPEVRRELVLVLRRGADERDGHGRPARWPAYRPTAASSLRCARSRTTMNVQSWWFFELAVRRPALRIRSMCRSRGRSAKSRTTRIVLMAVHVSIGLCSHDA